MLQRSAAKNKRLSKGCVLAWHVFQYFSGTMGHLVACDDQESGAIKQFLCIEERGGGGGGFRGYSMKNKTDIFKIKCMISSFKH